MNILLIISMVCSFAGCKPDDCPPEPVDGHSPVVWKKAFEKTYLSSTPYYYNETVIVGHAALQKNNYNVYCFDPATGDSIWKTTIVTPFEFNPNDTEESGIYGSKLVLSTRKRLFVIDANTGDVIWNYEDPNNYKGMHIIDGHVYIADAENNSLSTLYRFEINSGVKEKVFTINRSKYGGNY
ncbi:MAG: PQQ-binding-like beta-propeller repeat protein, partial [Bacteroidia bacterium]